jgi:hypothetical protein
VPLDLDQPIGGCVFQQFAERPVTVVLLVERRLLPLHRVLDHGGEQDFLVLPPQGQQGLDEQPEHLLLGLRELGRHAGHGRRALVQVVVINELVAVVAQQVGRGLGQPEADHVLAQLLELGHQRGEVGVAGDDDEGIDVVLRVGQVHGVHAQADVGRVLAGLPAAGDLDEFDRRLVQGGCVLSKPAPVGVGLLGDDLALLNQPLDDLVDLEAVAAVVQADADVFKIKKDGERALAVRMPRWFHSTPLGCGRAAVTSGRPGSSWPPWPPGCPGTS